MIVVSWKIMYDRFLKFLYNKEVMCGFKERNKKVWWKCPLITNNKVNLKYISKSNKVNLGYINKW